MEYEWDDAKADANLRKHGITFDVAAQALEDEKRVEVFDTRREYGESRVRTTGWTTSGLLSVVSTKRGHSVRLISARKANRREKQAYGYRANEL